MANFGHLILKRNKIALRNSSKEVSTIGNSRWLSVEPAAVSGNMFNYRINFFFFFCLKLQLALAGFIGSIANYLVSFAVKMSRTGAQFILIPTSFKSLQISAKFSKRFWLILDFSSYNFAKIRRLDNTSSAVLSCVQLFHLLGQLKSKLHLALILLKRRKIFNCCLFSIFRANKIKPIGLFL